MEEIGANHMAIRKQEPLPPRREETPAQEIAKFESAVETLMSYIGYLNTKVHEEEDRPQPNQNKIEALRAQIDLLWHERNSNLLENPELIDKAVYVYGPIMKAFYNSNDWW